MNFPGAGVQVCRCLCIAQLNPPANAQRNIPLFAGEVFQVNPYPILIGHQADLVGIHAAQCLGINRQHRFGAFAGDRLDGAVFKTDAVSALGQRQVLRVDFAVQLGGAADDVNIVGAAAVQPFTADGDAAFFHLQRLQRALLVELRFAGGQRHARRVDKAAAVAGDAIRVGDHHVGFVAEYLELALQLGTTASGDFVDDKFCWLPFQIRVALCILNSHAQLGLATLDGIIQHRTGRTDVKILVGIVRNPRPVRRGNIHHRHVARFHMNLGIAVSGGNTGGERRVQRLESRQVDQQIAGAPRQRMIELIHIHSFERMLF
ncbi:Uncharacterised protein [Serratia marcescens]|nr:Uncharacterised protein [Serratia marcescens]